MMRFIFNVNQVMVQWFEDGGDVGGVCVWGGRGGRGEPLGGHYNVQLEILPPAPEPPKKKKKNMTPSFALPHINTFIIF